MRKPRHAVKLLLVIAAMGGTAIAARQLAPRKAVGPQPNGSTLLPVNQIITPIGRVVSLPGTRPKQIALDPRTGRLAVLCQDKLIIYSRDGTTPEGEVGLNASALGLAWAPSGDVLFVSGEDDVIYRVQLATGKWSVASVTKIDSPLGGEANRNKESQPTGLAVSPDGTRIYAALGARNSVVVVRAADMTVERTVPVGVAPYAVLLVNDGRTLAVANRGGQPPEPATGSLTTAGTFVSTNPATDGPDHGSISLINTVDWTSTQIRTGKQPAGLAVDTDAGLLYAALSDDDAVEVVDMEKRKVVQRISLANPGDPGFGQIPTGLCLSADRKTLYVCCGGANTIAVVETESGKVKGYLPTGWYPIDACLQGDRLVVACAKGIGSRNADANGSYNVHASVGTLQWISPTDRSDLTRQTRQVAANNLWGRELAPRAGRKPVPIPERVGEPSVFKHVVYIIKENQTYDGVFGDVKEGNGMPSLAMFGGDVTPNHHALAREFVLLDNTYASGTNSADGHQWTVGAIANDYIERNYSAHVRSYPYDGGDPLAVSPAGFLWTAGRNAGITMRIYGEFVDAPKIRDRQNRLFPSWENLWADRSRKEKRFEILAASSTPAVRPYLHPAFIGFPSLVSDQYRADTYLEELAEFEKSGKMPALSVMLLPNDHTSGTRQGFPTPKASVADNDLALGRVVEGISKSRFWKETLILVIEDDAQLGLDHVDGHRTVALCISPYTRRGAVVSEVYNHTSMIRTIGLVLGMKPLNRFDRTATSLKACFVQKADITPYICKPNIIPLDQMNPMRRALRGEALRLAELSEKLDWSQVDRANAEVVTRAAWHSAYPSRPFPGQHFHAVVDDDD